MNTRSAIEPPGVMGARWISLTQGLFALIDEEDYPAVSSHRWCASKRRHGFQAATSIAGKLTKLHRFIMAAPPGQPVDHRDGDGLNCRRGNLRLCSQTENNRNKRKIAPQTSQYKGVSWDERCGRWMAKITVGRKQIYLGRFESESQAARAYDAAALDRFGEFARPNQCDI